MGIEFDDCRSYYLEKVQEVKMNRKIAFLIVIMTWFLSTCDSSKTDDSAHYSEQTAPLVSKSHQPESPKVKASSVKSTSSMYGYYVGEFVAVKVNEKKSPMYNNKINISIDSIQGDQILGHSVVAGNYRAFTGTISKSTADTYRIQVKEPGTHQYDGFFSFMLKADRLKGSWIANDKNLAVTGRAYDLKKTNFKYSPDYRLTVEDLRIKTGMFETLAEVFGSQYLTERDKKIDGISYHAEWITEDAVKFNASKKLLSAHDVENMYKRDLEVIRNTIYARHGYSFQNRQMRYFFDHIKWYVPVSVDITKELTEVELKNIKLLKRYENYARAYYDHFGR